MTATQEERIPVKLQHNFLFLVDGTKAAARTEPGKDGTNKKPVPLLMNEFVEIAYLRNTFWYFNRARDFNVSLCAACTIR